MRVEPCTCIRTPGVILLVALVSILGGSGVNSTRAVAADVIVVQGNLTVKRSKTEGPAAVRFAGEVRRALTELGIEHTFSNDTAVAQGALDGHRVAIFPYSAVWSDEEIARTVDFIRGGGKVILFYTVPETVRSAVGFRIRGLEPGRPGERFRVVRFNAQAPPNFPASFNNESHATLAAEPMDGSRIIAEWVSGNGKPTGIPAVLMGPGGFYMGHVFKGGDFAGHKAYLLAAVGHYLPSVWEKAVAATLEVASNGTRFRFPEGLRAEFARRNIQEPDEFQSALDAFLSARKSLAAKRYRDALRSAQQSVEQQRQAYASLWPSRSCELRGCWLGSTPDRDWDHVMSALADANFNAVFPLMCSGGSTMYPSEFLPMDERCTRDELGACCTSAKRHDVQVHVWRINWGMHGASAETIARFEREGRCIQELASVRAGTQEYNHTLCPSHPANRALERNLMVECVTTYPIDGIQFDYMRYGGEDQCFCDGCRERFSQWIDTPVPDWPESCTGRGKLAERYFDWRVHLITSLVKEISETIRGVRPGVQVSLAARTAPWPQRRRHDAQHWEEWVDNDYLDFLCPMNYTGSLDRLRKWLEYQSHIVKGRMPLYAGLGTTYDQRLNHAAIASDEVMLARTFGADGVIFFSYNDTFEDMLPYLARGVSSKPAASLPHEAPRIRFAIPEGIETGYLPTYPQRPQRQASVTVVMRDRMQRPLERVTADVHLQNASGTIAAPTADNRSLLALDTTSDFSRQVDIPLNSPGTFRLVALGTMTPRGGSPRSFAVRSPPFRILSREETEDALSLRAPPEFRGTSVRVGVLAGGYGSQGILAGLSQATGIQSRLIHTLEPDVLAACDVVIVPQFHDQVNSFTAEQLKALTAYVAAGGGLLVTHDLVGFRGATPLFPAICAGGRTAVRLDHCMLTSAGSQRLGLGTIHRIDHAYYDHITLTPGSEASVIAVSGDGSPVAVAGNHGKGRFVASGMAHGLASNDIDAQPEGTELAFLRALVRWLNASGE